MTPQNPGVPLTTVNLRNTCVSYHETPYMSKMATLDPYIHTHKNVYFIQKGVNLQFVLITNYPKLGLLPRFLQNT